MRYITKYNELYKEWSVNYFGRYSVNLNDLVNTSAGNQFMFLESDQL